jgi:ubiquinol-cytochrome c reductase cytochrome b subunit
VRLGDWLDERLGHRAFLKVMLDEPVRGGARWAYVFGSTLVFVLVLQAVTGWLLASFYAPSATDAWASVAYIENEVSLGWMIRGLHSAGASAMVILTALHLMQVTIWGAYKRPRELNWWIGLAMMALLFAFALTGYLLPWDQKGYWATQVATSLIGAMPGGPWLKRLLIGGAEYGNLTLTHFYSLHTMALPAALFGLLGAHILLFRKHGVTASWKGSDAELDRKTVPFWPDQLFRDFVAMSVVLGLMFAWVWRSHGVGLEAPADPSSTYDARPEWYFLPLYQLLKYFPGQLEVLAAVGAPLIAGGILFLLPLVDRGPSRDPEKRKLFILAVLSVLIGAAALGGIAEREDAGSAGFQKFRARAKQEAERALTLAKKGVPPAGGTAVYENDPVERGRKVYQERCAGCHQLGGAGERKAPDLDGWSSRAWIRAFLQDPENERFYGKTKIRGMKPVKAVGEKLDALVEWVYSQGGADGVDAQKAARGKQLLDELGCTDCHETDGQTGQGTGEPNLGGRASPAWLRAFLEDPSGSIFFGKKNEMPKMKGRLDDEDFAAVIELLRAERAGVK